MEKLVKFIAIFLGLVLLVNGTFMLLAPEPWYWTITGVAERGSFNQHFIRDVGIVYVISGISFIYGALYLRQRLALWLPATGFLMAHALFHVWEVAVGICGPQSLLDDFVGVTVPGLLGMALVLYAYKHLNSEDSQLSGK